MSILDSRLRSRSPPAATARPTRCGAGIVDADAAVRAALRPCRRRQLPNYEGLWWSSPAGSESGWGINLAHQGDVIFATWFTYDAAGKAWWLSMTANRTAANAYSGTLYQTHGPAFNAVPFDPAAVTATAGRVRYADIQRQRQRHVRLYGQRHPADESRSRAQVFGPLPTCTFGTQPDLAQATNYQDLWWASPAGSESGWGVNFTQQGDIDLRDVVHLRRRRHAAVAVGDGATIRARRLHRDAVSNDRARVRRGAVRSGRVVATPVGTATLSFADGNAGRSPTP